MPFPIPPPTRNRILAIAILSACAFCVAFPRSWQSRLRGRIHTAAHSPQALLASLHDSLRRTIDRATALWAASNELERLREENRALRETVARLADETHRREVTIHNFAELKSLKVLETQAAYEERQASAQDAIRILPARVIAADASPWRHSVLVDRGTDSGVRVGTPAVRGASIIGTIVALRPSVATVRLITDARAGLTVRVARTGEPGMLRGMAEGDADLILKWIYRHPVREDDLIVTAGLDPLIPAGLVAGRVVHASPRAEPLFYDVKARPLADLANLTEILLLVRITNDDVEDLRSQEHGAPN